MGGSHTALLLERSTTLVTAALLCGLAQCVPDVDDVLRVWVSVCARVCSVGFVL